MQQESRDVELKQAEAELAFLLARATKSYRLSAAEVCVILGKIQAQWSKRQREEARSLEAVEP